MAKQIRKGATVLHISLPAKAFFRVGIGVAPHSIIRQHSSLGEKEHEREVHSETALTARPSSPPTPPNRQEAHPEKLVLSSDPRQQSLLSQKTNESRKLASFQELAKLQTKLHKRSSKLRTKVDIDEKVAKQEQLVAQLDQEISQIQISSANSSRESKPRRPYQRPRSLPKWQMSKELQGPTSIPVEDKVGYMLTAQSRPTEQQEKPGGRQQNGKVRRADNPQNGSSLQSDTSMSEPTDNYLEYVTRLAEDTRTYHKVGSAYLNMVARCVVPTSSNFYAKVIVALLSPLVRDHSLAVRVMEDAQSLGLATQDMYAAIYGTNIDQRAFLETKLQVPRDPQVHSMYTKGTHTWRTVADYRYLVASASDLALDMRMLLFRMLEENDFNGCSEALTYMVHNNIPLPEAHTCEYLLASAARVQNVPFAEWLLATLAAQNLATEAMYSRVANLKCSLKDFKGTIDTISTMQTAGLTPLYDGLRAQLTATAQIGDFGAFTKITRLLHDHQSNLLTLTSLKLLTVLQTRGLGVESAQLLTYASTLLRPDLQYYTTLLHMASTIGDHERFYLLLDEMRANGLTPTLSSFRELTTSLRRTDRGSPENYARVLASVHSHGLVPDSSFLASLGKYEQNGPPKCLKQPHQSIPTRQPLSHSHVELNKTLSDIVLLLKEKGVRNALDTLASSQSLMDLAFYNALLQATSTAENLRECREIFREMEIRGVTPDATSYNYVLEATKHPDDYRKLAGEMKAKGVAMNERTYNRLLELLCNRRHWTEFDKVLDEMRMVVSINANTHAIILNAAGKRGNLQVAIRSAEAIKKTGASLGAEAYTSLILAACAQTTTAQAVQYFDEMKLRRIQPEPIACNRILQNWAKSGASKECGRMLEDMRVLGMKADLDTYSAMLQAILYQPGQALKGMSDITWELCSWLLGEMTGNGVAPSDQMFNKIAEYMAKKGDKQHFDEICNEMRKRNILPDVKLHTNLVEGLANMHEFDQAFAAIHDMRERSIRPTGFTYAVLLNGLMECGRWDECERVRTELKDTGEDSTVVTACDRLVEAGKIGNFVECSKITALLQPINEMKM